MISQRLRVVSRFLKGYQFLADCGTDHALLPIYAVEKGFVKKAIASDNKHHPLLSAKQNIADHRLYGKINTVLAEGLSYLNLEKNVDVVTILGMGGHVIREILEDAYLYNIKRMIIQPNSQHSLVREFLEEHKWQIIDEVYLEDNKKYYQIIVCQPGKMQLTALEKEFGPYILKEKSPAFIDRIQSMLTQLNKALEATNRPDTIDKLKKRIQFLEGAL
ncbi:MAG TPA: class I SAM-dependent methyltransferase [Candidatus Izemoplasmatales bacterium]|nr:class I SAM-dependent methyltransferase [Candidatus Izemoplasmatales bacterium]